MISPMVTLHKMVKKNYDQMFVLLLSLISMFQGGGFFNTKMEYELNNRTSKSRNTTYFQSTMTNLLYICIQNSICTRSTMYSLFFATDWKLWINTLKWTSWVGSSKMNFLLYPKWLFFQFNFDTKMVEIGHCFLKIRWFHWWHHNWSVKKWL